MTPSGSEPIKTPTRAILYGGTGQAKVTREILGFASVDTVLVVDDTPNLAAPFADVPLVHGMDALRAWLHRQHGSRDARYSPLGFCVTIGNPHGRARLRIADAISGIGLAELQAIHPHAVISRLARVGAGCQVMAGAIVQPYAVIGRQCIINTRASIDHDCVIGPGCGIAPGATLCGEVTLSDNVWIGAGATVLPRVRIGADAVVGAGAVVRHDVPAGSTVVGVPAHPLMRQ